MRVGIIRTFRTGHNDGRSTHSTRGSSYCNTDTGIIRLHGHIIYGALPCICDDKTAIACPADLRIIIRSAAGQGTVIDRDPGGRIGPPFNISALLIDHNELIALCTICSYSRHFCGRNTRYLDPSAERSAIINVVPQGAACPPAPVPSGTNRYALLSIKRRNIYHSIGLCPRGKIRLSGTGICIPFKTDRTGVQIGDHKIPVAQPCHPGQASGTDRKFIDIGITPREQDLRLHRTRVLIHHNEITVTQYRHLRSTLLSGNSIIKTKLRFEIRCSEHSVPCHRNTEEHKTYYNYFFQRRVHICSLSLNGYQRHSSTLLYLRPPDRTSIPKN